MSKTRKLKNRILSLLLTFSLFSLMLSLSPTASVNVFAEEANSDFTIVDGMLTKYNGNGGDVVIPDGVMEIGSEAFFGCTSLTSIAIPDSVTSIESYAFDDCTSLTSVTIPDSVTNIGYDAFSDTPWFEAQEDGVVYVGKVAYSWKGEMPENYTLELKDDAKSIANGAFFNCASLTSVTIPDSVTSIGWYAFSDCTSLTSVTIPGSVTNIGESAFSDCTNLTSVTIPDSVTSIGSSAFWNCTLTSVTIPDSVTSIGSSAFAYCTNLTSVTIGDSVTSIGSSAFYGTSWFEAQEDGVVYAGKVAYQWKGKVPENYALTLKDDTKGIAGSAFYGRKGLTSVTIPNSVTSIGEDAFYDCTNLTSVTIPDSVTSIGYDAFDDCTALASVTFTSETAPSFGGDVFRNCDNLTTIYVPVGTKSAYETALSGIMPKDCTVVELAFPCADCGGTNESHIDCVGRDCKKLCCDKCNPPKTFPEGCPICGEVKCKIPHGRIRDNDEETSVSDALEILMYLADMDSSIIHNDKRAKSAAIITNPNGEEPTISDALDILMYLAGMKQSKLYGLYRGKR